MTPSALIEYDRFRSTKYFPSLDGLRAISILAVIWYHVPELRPLWATGFLGVHLFFVISGFLITTLLLREKSATGKISLKNFYIRRTLRIFPAYYLTLGLFLLLCLAVPDLRANGLATYIHNLPSFLTYTSNWFVYPWGPGRVVFVAAWSLATEEQFYLFWPGIIAIGRKWYIPVIVMLLLIVANEVIKIKFGYLFFLSGQSLPITMLNSVSTAICFGCLLAYALDRPGSFSIAWKVLGQTWSPPFFMLVMGFVAVIPNNDELHVLRMFYICTMMTLAVASCCIRTDNLLRPILANRAVRYLGSISYGMYLYHAFGINLTDRFFGFTKPWPLLQFAAVVISTAAIASISYWFYERYFLRLKERFQARRSLGAISTSALADASAEYSRLPKYN